MQYEVLASNPVLSIKAVYNFLNWPMTAEVQKEIPSFILPRSNRTDKKDDGQYYYSTKRDYTSFDPNHWRKELSSKEVKSLEVTPSCRDLLKEFGYPTVFSR